MSAKKSPLARQKDEHGSKEKLVDKLVSVLGHIKADKEGGDDLKTRLLAASNKKLLRLFAIGSDIQSKFGSVEKLADETAKVLGRAKDAPYVAKLKSLSASKLYDMFTAAAKKAKRAA